MGIKFYAKTLKILYNMSMIKMQDKNLSIRQISISGQCFRMDEIGDDKFLIIAGDRALCAREQSVGDETAFYCTKREWDSFWSHYFDMKRDYGKIIDSIDKRDRHLTKAASISSGVRILNQDLWEMILSFIISQQNNIPRIKKSIKRISEKYGEELDLPKGISASEISGLYENGIFGIPAPERLAALREDALMQEGLGYRSKYVVRTARCISEGTFDLDELRKMPYEDAREKLLTLYGVGKKVADCVCLFGLHHVEAFPIDTHVRQILDAHYKKGFPHKRYCGYAGILQQYMFYYDLNG